MTAFFLLIICFKPVTLVDAKIQWSSEVMQETVALVERLHSSQSSEDAMLHDGRTFCAGKSDSSITTAVKYELPSSPWMV